ncbi:MULTISPECIES: hypothetical protein [Bacillales]|uniref:Uncharacterized protein n=1 Tax=Brevibacillus brevis (strain 47 / JCM 6285 / NBRC 100599) TaxID=358681 RepID=C0ZCT0_BREBN|nr:MULTISPECIES: hypothetical protein [Bacillales]KMZ41066.1 hypothetical protein AC624_08190 [Bacillus sp. FJAT-27238]MBH0328866.1 hypothetical protein [Brevibacillus brevis]NQF12833.1 hypothetical protein [Brevibacillus sp. HB1.3]NRR02942.1 hypothetical protein [Brevibacillus sp. RS1.1]NRS51331.1 hypothetical protein [Brevibacillus sp. HB2.2]
MTEPNQNEKNTTEQKPGKISLQEAMKRKMAEKKQAQAQANNPMNQKAQNQSMKSQLTKKPNNQRRRMGV